MGQGPDGPWSIYYLAKYLLPGPLRRKHAAPCPRQPGPRILTPDCHPLLPHVKVKRDTLWRKSWLAGIACRPVICGLARLELHLYWACSDGKWQPWSNRLGCGGPCSGECWQQSPAVTREQRNSLGALELFFLHLRSCPRQSLLLLGGSDFGRDKTHYKCITQQRLFPHP